MSEIQTVFFMSSIIERLAIIALGFAAIATGIAIWRNSGSLLFGILVSAGGAFIVAYGLIGSELSLQGDTLLCGTFDREIILSDFKSVRERTGIYSASHRLSRTIYQDELIFTGPGGNTAKCALYHQLAPADRERLLAEIRARLRA